MSELTHWLQSPNKNYLGHWDLPESKDLILTIKSAQWEEVKNPITNKSEAKRVIRFEEKVKPMICNQTNAQAITKSTGIKWMERSGGKSISLFVGTHKDSFTKELVDCIRIRLKPSITLEDIKKLYEEKKILVSTDDVSHIEGVISKKNVKLYQRVHDFLSKLKV